MSQSIIRKRINREIAALKEDGHFISQDDTDENISVKLKIFGPEDSPFQNGVYLINVNISLKTYPFVPPEVSFESNIFHPNISDGSICIDILSGEWSSALTLYSLVKSLENLLSDPNPDSPLDSNAADAFLSDPDNYNKINQDLILKNQEANGMEIEAA